MVVCIFKIHNFYKAFFLYSNLLRLKKYFFAVSMETVIRETSSFIAIKQLINPDYLWKNRVKQIKTTQEKLLQRCIFYPSTKDPDPSNRVKMQQKLLFKIFTTICLYTWVDLIYLAALNFLNPFNGQFGLSVIKF